MSSFEAAVEQKDGQLLQGKKSGIKSPTKRGIKTNQGVNKFKLLQFYMLLESARLTNFVVSGC